MIFQSLIPLPSCSQIPKPSYFKKLLFYYYHSWVSKEKLGSTGCLELRDAHEFAVRWGWIHLRAHTHPWTWAGRLLAGAGATSVCPRTLPGCNFRALSLLTRGLWAAMVCVLRKGQRVWLCDLGSPSASLGWLFSCCGHKGLLEFQGRGTQTAPLGGRPAWLWKNLFGKDNLPHAEADWRHM